MASASKTPPARRSFGAVRQRVPYRPRAVGQRPRRGAGEANRCKRALGLATNMGRQAAARRNCEGFGADPFLSGVGSCAHITRSTDAGVTEQQDYHWRVEEESGFIAFLGGLHWRTQISTHSNS
ncbi:hypothetical protein B0H14DRAFT_3682995 [Mycena olivaceomarginata]|nr:hypothetical protein B0H14DRAFT_3682995 [Mycena olivaceomarginata]